MSKSRLEKFLYALYSLDSSDLPNPLSRIEELYKCLVTGEEAPSFEPISRTEKYLMAILGVYDANELPNPISRVEVLLYKLAIGDDNLDDIKSFLSEHEELLAEIIRNGGAGGNIDIEYMLYTLSTEFNTLYNTAEKPVKSAILKGNTLVNLFKNKNNHRDTGKFIYVEEGDKIQATFKDGVTNGWIGFSFKENVPFEIGKTYTVMNELYKCDDQLSTFNISLGNKMFVNTEPVIGINKLKITIPSDYTEGINWMYYNVHNTNNSATIFSSNLLILEGDYTQEDIPYFEGMQSVKMPVLTTTGKNLLTGLTETPNTTYTFDKGVLTTSKHGTWGRYGIEWHLNLKKDVSYYFHCDLISGNYRTNLYKKDGTLVGNDFGTNLFHSYYTVPEDGEYIFVVGSDQNNVEVVISNLQLTTEKTKTPYEPYKSNILTVNEPVELRGIGEVKDELNLITGELTQRVEEIVLDGSENWNEYTLYGIDGYTTFITTIPSLNNLYHDTDKIFISADFPVGTWEDYRNNLIPELVWNHDPNKIGIRVKSEKASTVKEIKEFLSTNNIRINYELVTESIKTVDLSVVDKDGNDTELSTFNDITYVTLSSEALIPEAELEVATKNEEDLEDTSVYTVHTLSEGNNTLYNTAEKPVKSAILKGNTLVNLANRELKEINVNINNSYYLEKNLTDNINSTKKYLIRYNYSFISGDVSSPLTTLLFYDNNWRYLGENPINESNFTHIITPKEGTTRAKIRLGRYGSSHTSSYIYRDIMLIEYQDGMENWDIPYFEGMKSVQMPVLTTTGKNLFNFDDLEANSTTSRVNKSYIRFDETKRFSFSMPGYVKENGARYVVLLCYDDEFNYLGCDALGDRLDKYENRTVLTGTKYIKVSVDQVEEENPSDVFEAQLEYGKAATTYEPFKSNILTTPSDLELRGIGDVQDTLDCLTGEVTERVGTGELNGTESWIWKGFNTDISFVVKMSSPIKNIKSDSKLLLDKFNYGVGSSFSTITFREMDGTIGVHLPKNTIDDWENDWEKKLPEFLSKNNINFKYELATESVKTIDISTVNQDGNNTELSTFNDITHVTLSSEGLIPEAELEVAEKVPEVAASMLTISREQEVIDTTTNEQSENVDATMIATTEIYEGLL